MTLYFTDYGYFIPFILTLLVVWTCFFKMNAINIPILDLNIDKKKQIKIQTKSVNLDFYIRLNKFSILILIIVIFFFKFFNQALWFNHFFVTSYSFYILLVLFICNYFFLYILHTLIFSKDKYKVDLFFSFINLSILLPLIFLCNTFYSFFFFLEVNSIIIFYKFVMSKVLFSQKINKQYSLNKIFPKHFINMLFFQYWTAFVSSVLLIYILLNFLFQFGSSEWIIINALLSIIGKDSWTSLFFFVAIFFCGFFTKLGITPIHLYKIEVYKGLSFLTIFFYTTYYFLVFFLFFCLLLLIYLNGFYAYFWFNLIIMLLIGSMYVFALIFEINYIKAFFAYSTIINSLGFICLVVSTISVM